MKPQKSFSIFLKMKTSYKKDGRNNKPVSAISRRDFLKYSGAAGGALLFGLQGDRIMASSKKSRVAFIGTEDRKSGVSLSIKTLGINPVKNKDVLIKPNFNTADRTPGSTHNDTLVALQEIAPPKAATPGAPIPPADGPGIGRMILWLPWRKRSGKWGPGRFALENEVIPRRNR